MLAFDILKLFNSNEAPKDRVLKEVPIDSIQPNPFQPRKNFDEKSIIELSESIKQVGLIQPLVVKETENGYELIAGERRWRACKLAGKEKVPVIVIKATPQEQQLLALIENIQREDLNPLEEAESLLNILKITGWTQQQLAKKLGRTQATISNKLRLLKLEPEVKQSLREGKIGERHARSLIGLPREKQLELLKEILESDIPADEVEKKVKLIKKESSNFKGQSQQKTDIIKLVKKDLKRLIKRWNNKGLTVNINNTESEGFIRVEITISKGGKL